jgi:hypothetical protein
MSPPDLLDGRQSSIRPRGCLTPFQVSSMNRRERPAGLGQNPAGQAERRRVRADQGHSAHCVVIRVAVQEPSPDGFPGAGLD